MPFSDNLFDVVCSHFGFDECREIPTILKEAARVLKPGGRFVSVSRHNAWLRRHDIFEKYDIGENEALKLMRKVRLYTDFEHFIHVYQHFKDAVLPSCWIYSIIMGKNKRLKVHK